MTRLAGKVALVTGGASGLGRGIAQRFSEEGATTIITDVNRDLLQETANELQVESREQNVAEESQWQALIDEVQATFGKLDVLVNNAGIFTSCPVDETPLEQWQKVMDVNLTGVFLGCKHGVRAMKANPHGPSGSIINLSSVVGLRGQSGGASYSASKGGVKMLTKTVALEVAAIGIRCNSIHPGVIDTPIMDPLFAASPDPETMRANIEATLPMGAMGDPARDVGNMALYLASDESVYITGTEMVVDGGMITGLPSSRS